MQRFSPVDLTDETLHLITVLLDPDPLEFPPGSRIVIQGEPGDAMYFIAEGSVEITMTPFGPGSPFPPVHLGLLAAGDIFGEMALVHDEPRSATVTAVDDVTVYRLSVDNWRYIEAFHPGLAARIRDLAALRREDQDLYRTDGYLQQQEVDPPENGPAEHPSLAAVPESSPAGAGASFQEDEPPADPPR